MSLVSFLEAEKALPVTHHSKTRGSVWDAPFDNSSRSRMLAGPDRFDFVLASRHRRRSKGRFFTSALMGWVTCLRLHKGATWHPHKSLIKHESATWLSTPTWVFHHRAWFMNSLWRAKANVISEHEQIKPHCRTILEAISLVTVDISWHSHRL